MKKTLLIFISFLLFAFSCEQNNSDELNNCKAENLELQNRIVALESRSNNLQLYSIKLLTQIDSLKNLDSLNICDSIRWKDSTKFNYVTKINWVDSISWIKKDTTIFILIDSLVVKDSIFIDTVFVNVDSSNYYKWLNNLKDSCNYYFKYEFPDSVKNKNIIYFKQLDKFIGNE